MLIYTLDFKDQLHSYKSVNKIKVDDITSMCFKIFIFKLQNSIIKYKLLVNKLCFKSYKVFILLLYVY